MHFSFLCTTLLILIGLFSDVLGYEARRHPLDKGVRFGYQNPIRVAPTLSPNVVNYQPEFEFNPTQTPSRAPNLRCNDQLRLSRLDKRTQQCVQIGSTEPCGPKTNMAFYPLPNDNIHGECDCIKTSMRPLVYHENTDTCYFVYQQAYCPTHMWLVFENGKPVCQANPCREYGAKELRWDWTQNNDVETMNTRGIVPIFEKMECVPLGSTCETDGSFTFYAGQRQPNRIALKFKIGDTKPGCYPDLDTSRPVNPVVPLSDCRPGSKLSIRGQC